MHLFMKRTVYIIPSGEMHLLFNGMDGWYWEKNECLDFCSGATAASKNISAIVILKTDSLELNLALF